MQRIETLLKKISDISSQGNKNSVIDIDLALDYVKVVYADLLEWRDRVAFTSGLPGNEPDQHAVQEKIEVTENEAMIVNAPFAATDTQVIPEALPDEKEIAVAVAEEAVPVITQVATEDAPLPVYDIPVKHDIRKVIGINDKYLFISELFGNDKDTYENALDEISKLDTYDEAMEWMNENVLFVSESEEEENGTAQLFYDTIGNFFSAR